MRAVALRPLLLLGAALVLGPGVPALAAPGGPGDSEGTGTTPVTAASIAHVEGDGTRLQLLVNVPPDADVDLSAVTARVGDQDATALAEPAGEASAELSVRRTTILVVDTSNSMRGERITQARSAAKRFIRSAPADVRIGVVGFAGTVRELLEPTLDRAAASQVITDLTLAQDTRLHDGVIAGAAEAGTEGQRVLLVMSDGADTSDTPLSEAVAAITDGGLGVDVVSLDPAGADAADLGELAAAGGGQVLTASGDALQRAFADAAATLADQVVVSVELPASVLADGTAEANVSITLPSAAGALDATTFASLAPTTDATGDPATALGDDAAGQDPGTTAAASQASSGVPGWMLWAGPVVLGTGLLVLLALLVPAAPAPLSAEDRVSRYTARQASGSGKVDPEQAISQVRDAAADLLQRNQGLEVTISKKLESAGSELRSAEWLLVHGGVFLASGLLGLLLSRGNIVVGVLFLLFGLAAPWVYLGLRAGRRKKAFQRALPDTLQLMSGSLAAGLSLAQSVNTIVREGPEPVAGEFKRVLVETRLGVGLEDAMDGISERFASKDFEWVVMAIRIQRQVGGNLAELLETVAATMREREYIRRQVASLAAEGKLSAWVLGLLPPMFLLYLLLANRTYVMVMFTEPLGWLMLGGAAMILSVGVFWMSRLIKIEI